MKSIQLLIFIFGISICQLSIAQKTGYVDTKYILEKMPEYVSAEKQLEQLSQQWQKELDGMYAKIEDLWKKYQAEEVLLSTDLKKQRQQEIIDDEAKAKDFQKKKFGVNGELFKQREQKVKPIQDKVFTALEEVAKDMKLNMIFDKSGSLTMLYSDSNYDYSDKVLSKLGISTTGK